MQLATILEPLLIVPNGARLSAILYALGAGWEPQRIADLTHIHPWFIDRLSSLVRADTPAGPGAYKMVDTCAGEFEARTPYFYRSEMEGAQNEALPLPSVMAFTRSDRSGFDLMTAFASSAAALSAARVASICLASSNSAMYADAGSWTRGSGAIMSVCVIF